MDTATEENEMNAQRQACEPCTVGRHAECTAQDSDCTNLCHPGYDPEWSVEPVGFGNEFAVYVRGRGRVVMQSRPEAEAEAARILRGIEADERWFGQER